MDSAHLKKIFTSRFFIPISILVLGFSFIAFFMNCSMDSMNTADTHLTSSSENIAASTTSTQPQPSTQSQKDINRNCRYEFDNGCYNGTLNDVPDINRTLKWQCTGSFGTAHCIKYSRSIACAGDSQDAYCLDGVQKSLPETETHTWFQCDEDGKITHCSTPKENVVDAACGHGKNDCLLGTLNDTPDINRTFRWQCIGENGGITANCDISNTTAFACSLEGYCLDGEYLDLPNTATHDWFQCTEDDGTVTHCSTPITNGACGGDETGPYCLDGTYNLIEETSSYWKYQCVGSDNGTTAACFQCKNTPNYGPNEDETACLPSCGHACNLSSATGTCASGNACSDTQNYNITSITDTYQTPCCKRTPKTTSTTTQASTATTQAGSVCPSDKVEPHYKAVGNQCLPSCGHACNLSSAAGTCASGSACSDTQNYNITSITDTYQTPCCKRTSKTTSTQSSGTQTQQQSVCPSDKVYPHYKAVGNQCLPSCGHACSLSSAAGTCASGNDCNDTQNYNITSITDTYQTPCCKRTPKTSSPIPPTGP